MWLQALPSERSLAASPLPGALALGNPTVRASPNAADVDSTLMWPFSQRSRKVTLDSAGLAAPGHRTSVSPSEQILLFMHQEEGHEGRACPAQEHGVGRWSCRDYTPGQGWQGGKGIPEGPLNCANMHQMYTSVRW